MKPIKDMKFTFNGGIIFFLLAVSALFLAYYFYVDLEVLKSEWQQHALYMTALTEQGVPYINKDTYILTKEHIPNSISYGQFENRFIEINGKPGYYVAHHFWAWVFYSLPIAYVFKSLGLTPFLAVKVTNLILTLIPAGIILKHSKRLGNKGYLVIVTLFCGLAVSYVSWSIPDYFVYIVISNAIVFYICDYKKASLICTAVAVSVQPLAIFYLIVLGIFYLVDITGFFPLKSSEDRHGEITKALRMIFRPLNLLLYIVILLLVMSQPLYYLLTIDVINPLVEKGTYSFKSLSIEKAIGHWLEPNFGMLVFYGPLLFFVFALNSVRGKYFFLGFLIAGIAISLVMSGQGIYQPVSTPMGRYGMLFVPVLIALVSHSQLTNWMLWAACSSLILIHFGTNYGTWGNQKFSSLAQRLLDYTPELYNPVVSVFTSRTADFGARYPVYTYIESSGLPKKLYITTEAVKLDFNPVFNDEFISVSLKDRPQYVEPVFPSDYTDNFVEAYQGKLIQNAGALQMDCPAFLDLGKLKKSRHNLAVKYKSDSLGAVEELSVVRTDEMKKVPNAVVDKSFIYSNNKALNGVITLRVGSIKKYASSAPALILLSGKTAVCTIKLKR